VINASPYAKSTGSSRFYRSLKKPVGTMWSEPRPGSATLPVHDRARPTSSWSPKIQALHVKARAGDAELIIDPANLHEEGSFSIIKNNGELNKDLMIVLASELETAEVPSGNHVSFSKHQIAGGINHNPDTKMSLAMFKHVKGSKVSEGLYDDFRLETGEIVHFYQKGEMLNGTIYPTLPDFPR
jgi:hypothetical protein